MFLKIYIATEIHFPNTTIDLWAVFVIHSLGLANIGGF